MLVKSKRQSVDPPFSVPPSGSPPGTDFWAESLKTKTPDRSAGRRYVEADRVRINVFHDTAISYGAENISAIKTNDDDARNLTIRHARSAPSNT